MSKFPNSHIVIPAAGIVAIILGVGFGLATMNHGADRIATLQSSFDRERAMVAAEATRADAAEAELARIEADTDARLAALEVEASERVAQAERELEALRAELSAVSSTAANTDTESSSEAVITRASASVDAAPGAGGPLGLGREAHPEELAAWDVDVLPDGRGLPEGSGDVWTGEEVFTDYCAACHGDFAEGRDAWPSLAGGFGTLDERDPVKTVGSYWPYLSTVWDYVHRSMPFGSAGTLTDDEVYAITAYILYSNDLVDDDFTLSRETFFDVEMPNADGFIVDDRPATEYPVWTGEPCMTDCKDGPAEITRRATDVGVTPADDGSMAESVMEERLATLGGTEWGAERVAGSVFMDPERMFADEAAAEAEAEAGAESEGTEVASAATDTTAETAAADGPDPQLVAAGESVFRQCSSCHQVGEGARNRSGPVLNDVMGRPAASVDDFRYSSAIEEAAAEGLVWTEDTLHSFLTDPKGFLKGTRMSFRGLKSEDDLAAITAYLESFSE